MSLARLWLNLIRARWHITFAALSGWVNERQQQIIEFQNAQIEALLQKLGTNRILLTDDQRRILAVKGHALGRKAPLMLVTTGVVDIAFLVMAFVGLLNFFILSLFRVRRDTMQIDALIASAWDERHGRPDQVLSPESTIRILLQLLITFDSTEGQTVANLRALLSGSEVRRHTV